MRLSTLTILVGCFFLGCSPYHVTLLAPTSEAGALAIMFCDLPSHQGELVRVRAIYSGVEEYWGLEAPDSCSTLKNVYLEDGELYRNTEGDPIWRRLRDLRSKYSLLEGELEVTGTFQADSTAGFGHLNSFKSQIVAKSLTLIRIREK